MLRCVVCALVVLLVRGGACASLPVFTTSGSHYDVGKAVGVNFADRINGYIANYYNLNQILLPFYATSSGKAALDSLLAMNKAKFPYVYDEIRGTIDGAKANETAIYLLAFEDELSALAPPALRRLAASPFERCTDVMLSNITTPTTLIGHNEDADPLTPQYAYIINATYIEKRKEVVRIFGFCYPGNPPGEAWGISSHQMVFSQNAVFPAYINPNGLANLFVSRALYDCDNIECAFSLYETNTRYFASGYSMNIGTYYDSDHRIYNVEIASNSTSILPISGNYTHVNLYQHSPSVEQLPDPSSDHRLAISWSLPDVTNATSILNLLGNTIDPQYPVYRNGVAPDCCSTVTTTLFDLQARTATYFFLSNPSSSTPVATFTLP